MFAVCTKSNGYAWAGTQALARAQLYNRAPFPAPPPGLPAPDVTLWMALPPGAAAARGGFGQERYEDPAFQEQVGR